MVFLGFKTWECYMLLKYGKPNEWGLGGQYEYLIVCKFCVKNIEYIN